MRSRADIVRCMLHGGDRDLGVAVATQIDEICRRLPVPERIGPEILFSQTCGYPLETIFSGQAIRLGTPCYAVPGCDGPTQMGLRLEPAVVAGPQ